MFYLYLVLGVLFLFSIVINIILGYIIYNLVIKLEKCEDWITFFRTEIENVYKKLKSIDELYIESGFLLNGNYIQNNKVVSGIFEKDDDVGFLFSELVRIMEEFDNKIK